MWSGLLPPGLNESDVESDSGDEATSAATSQEGDADGTAGNPDISAVPAEQPETEPETIVDAYEACPAGVSLNMWTVRLPCAALIKACVYVCVCGGDLPGKGNRLRTLLLLSASFAT